MGVTVTHKYIESSRNGNEAVDRSFVTGRMRENISKTKRIQ